MYDNYNYPPGSDTPDAPWNEIETRPIDIKADVNISLSRAATVSTTNYATTVDEEDGTTGYEVFDTYKDVGQLYEQQHYSVPGLLAELAKYIKGELCGDVSRSRRQELAGLLADCEGWEQNFIEIENYEH